MLNSFVTGDKSWVHQYQPQLKPVSMQWKHPSSTSTKKCKNAINWEGCAYRVLGFSGTTVGSFLEVL
jgi:hypothetical protein